MRPCGLQPSGVSWVAQTAGQRRELTSAADEHLLDALVLEVRQRLHDGPRLAKDAVAAALEDQIGRASCRERVS